jgi:transposase
MVADSALYTAPNLEMVTNLRWLTRVPLSLKQAQQMVSQLKVTEFSDSSVIGYRWSEQRSNYGGIAQRWLVVESSFRGESDRRKLEKNLKKAELESKKNCENYQMLNLLVQPMPFQQPIAYPNN